MSNAEQDKPRSTRGKQSEQDKKRDERAKGAQDLTEEPGTPEHLGSDRPYEGEPLEKQSKED